MMSQRTSNRIRMRFARVFSFYDLSSYIPSGWLSRSWLPDEIIKCVLLHFETPFPDNTSSVDFLPQTVKVPRRHAFRYVKIEVIATSSLFGVKSASLQYLSLFYGLI